MTGDESQSALSSTAATTTAPTAATATAEIMGTVISIAARVQSGSGVFESATRAAFDALRDADRIFSTYRPDSPVSQIRDGRLALDRLHEHPDGEAIRTVLALSAQLKRESDGAFDIWSVGDPLTAPGSAPSSASASTSPRPHLAEPAFDPSGLVKGWAAERASRLLAEAGLPSHSLGAGGDIQVRGGRIVPDQDGVTRPWRIGVSDPHRPDRKSVV